MGHSVIRFCTAAALAASLLAPSPVRAQDVTATEATVDSQVATPPSPRAPSSRSFLRAYFLFDSTELAAAESFGAVIGKSRLSMLGGGGEVLGLWKGLFARVAFSSVKETGSRVVVFDDEVIDLGIPLTVEMRPLEVAAGWRFPGMLRGRLVPYAGGGLLRMGYKERSEFAIGDDNTDTTFTGTLVFGGLEASIVSWVIAGAEVQYRSVPDALGGGGVSQAFGENDLGGVTVRVLVGIRR
jgi:hypothetical protein